MTPTLLALMNENEIDFHILLNEPFIEENDVEANLDIDVDDAFSLISNHHVFKALKDFIKADYYLVVGIVSHVS